MKKIVLYLTMITVVATALYYGSYRYFYTVSENDDMIQNTEESKEALESDGEVVTRTTKVVVEYYDKDTGRTTYENLRSNTEFLGYNREQLIEYTKDYLNHMSAEDESKGLYDYQLISFADNQICFRKSYEAVNEDSDTPRYFVGIVDYIVVIYCNDEDRTVYEITDIDSRLLPVKVANQLSEGIYFYEEYDLYNFLEAYSR